MGSEPDENLIAAAPDLLAALTELFEQVTTEPLWRQLTRSSIGAARAAIEKAEWGP